SAPADYLAAIERKAQIDADRLDALLATHLVPAEHLRANDFAAFFAARRELLCQLVEGATGKSVQRDVAQGQAQETSAMFAPAALAETPAQED
ncbi:MAG TPA: hypothetical protein PKE32_05165, partial [Miltoncostaeaceae bacterium]|nr:hypothetical protein [Miltoncostaeaceae bacterium]